MGTKTAWGTLPIRLRKEFTRMVILSYGGICHICNHPGARQVDHLKPVTEYPELMLRMSNCRPAHGAPGNRCPVCHENCNQLRGGYSVERAQRIIAGRTGKRNPPAARISPETGREF